jgi:hypothetical protein
MRWFLVSLALMVGSAQSQGPVTSPTKGAEDSKTQAAKGEQKAKQDRRGTESSPLVVDVLRPKKSEVETAQDTKDREDRATETRISFWFNFLLVLFNFILAISTVLLWIVTKKSADTSERQVNDFRKMQSAQLTVDFAPEITESEGKLDISGIFKIENVGGTVAKHIDIRSGGWSGGEPPPAFGGLTSTPSPKGPSLVVGRTLEHSYSSGLNGDLTTRSYIQCWIAVSYRDIFDQPEIVQACYVYDSWAKRKRFTPC